MVSTKLNGRSEFLRELLGCGGFDLELLDDVRYDWAEVLDLLDWPNCGGFSLEELMAAVVTVGIDFIREAIDSRILELEALDEEGGPNRGEEEELFALQELNPSEDIHGCFDGLTSHLWFKKNEEIYREYLSDQIESLEYNTGLRF